MVQDSADAVDIVGIRKARADLAPVAAEFIGRTAVFALSEEKALLLPPQRDQFLLPLHDGAILSMARARSRLVTGGDDGRVVSLDEALTADCLFVDGRGGWIDHVAGDAAGNLAWSTGKRVFFRADDGTERTIEVPSSVGGLTFAGEQLAIARYDGVTLWQPWEETTRALEWKGSHTAVRFSSTAGVLVTAMREPTLHAWRLKTGEDLPMPGYPARVRSMDWTADGNFLATSGSDRLTLLSFQTEDNPLARMPLLLAPYSSLVAAVSCHPVRNIVAVGYADGLVMLVRIPDGAEILIKAPDAAAIAALRWSVDGGMLAIASESGLCEVVSIG